MRSKLKSDGMQHLSFELVRKPGCVQKAAFECESKLVGETRKRLIAGIPERMRALTDPSLKLYVDVSPAGYRVVAHC